MLTRDAIAKLTLLLRLPATGGERVWAVEAADPARIDEFVAIYQQAPLSLPDRAALMALLLASADRFLVREGRLPRAWATLCRLLAEEAELHEDAVAHWTCADSPDPAQWFPLTPYLRDGLG